MRHGDDPNYCGLLDGQNDYSIWPLRYGASIADLGRSIQRNVKQSIERMTGLEVVEVNVAVDDVHLPTPEGEEKPPPRVS